MIINHNDTIQTIIDKYKKKTTEPLDFDEIRGITKIILEYLCEHENIWDKNELEERSKILDPLNKKLSSNIEKLIRDSLKKTILNEDIQKSVLKPISKEVTKFITKNTIY